MLLSNAFMMHLCRMQQKNISYIYLTIVSTSSEYGKRFGRKYSDCRVQICLGLWQTDHFTVWESSENRLVLLLEIDYPDFSETYCRPLRLHKIGEKWLLDQSYEGRAKWYSWEQ